MAGRGGKRPGAGRPKGSRTKVVRERRESISELARTYDEEAMRTLAEVMRDALAPAAARVAASNSILDRGYGKPPQAITGEGGGAIQIVIGPADADL